MLAAKDCELGLKRQLSLVIEAPTRRLSADLDSAEVSVHVLPARVAAVSELARLPAIRAWKISEQDS